MRKFIALIFVFCILSLIGCNSQQQLESLSDDASMEDAINIIPEGVFQFSEQNNLEIDFQSYMHMRGTSSVNSRILIYRYNDYLVFAVAYQNGSESAMETYFLSHSQGEKFLNLVSDYQVSKKTDNGLNKMGGDESEYLLTLQGNVLDILPLDLSALNLELIDKNILFEANLTDNFTAANIDEYIKSSRMGIRDALLSCIMEQIKQITSSPIISISAKHVGKIDSIMTAESADGKEFQLLVTNDGCLVAVSENGKQDNPDTPHNDE